MSDWATDLIWEPQFASQFHWDAEKIFQCSGQSFTHIFHEPWTSDAFWDAQIPDGGHVLALILYADKTKLSSFGKAKGYPVVAHCANLPTEIWNGDGFGESGKPEFINFKHVVWHTSFEKVIQLITMHSKSGCWLECGDGIQQHLFPVVLMLSANYEEQTTADTQTVIKDACKLQSTTKHEKLLSHLSFMMSIMSSGISEQFKILIAGYGCSQEEQVDKQFNDVPCWSGLNHFWGVMKVSFTDSSKYEDISKLIVFIAHNIIPSCNQESEGWLLLQCFFDNIKQKGATHNYNTKPNEKLHGPLKKTYKMHTNFKDIGPQILKLEHLKFIFSSIYSQLNNVECIENKDEDVDKVPEVLSSSHPLPDVAQVPQLQGHVLIDGHIDLCSQQPTMTFTVMEESLHTSLASWLTKELPAYDFDKAGDYLVMDVVDHTRDLFLHCTTPPFSAQQENIISNYNGKDALVEEEQMDEWFCTSYEQSSGSGPSLVQVP
ncbi:hypothetical protein BJV74DRAFT_797311 [Russula compacta]|nr:hypothetical protein BJV74DRAFT_797311 [Russula compacta]